MENPINYWYQKYLSLKAEMDKMKAEAVDGIYTKSIDGKNVFVESGALKIDPASVKVGDPVHIIVLPKED